MLPPPLTAPKLLLYGIGLMVGGLGLAVLMGAVGAEMLARYLERR